MPHRVLFVDVGNACRGQIAVGFARRFGLEADSAGTMPAREVARSAVLAMRERGIDISGLHPAHVEFGALPRYERVISMGPGVAATDPDLPVTEHWDIDDPVNLGYRTVRRIRDDIERRVNALAREMAEWGALPSLPAAA
jgi:arsenate reductase